MSASATSTNQGAGAGPSPADAFTSVLNTAVGSVAARLEKRVGGWADRLNGVAAGGAKQRAGAEGVKAGLQGKSPIRAAIKGAWQAGTPVVRAAIVAALVSLVLLLLVSPVVAVVFLLSLLVIAAVHRARSAQK